MAPFTGGVDYYYYSFAHGGGREKQEEPVSALVPGLVDPSGFLGTYYIDQH